MLNNIKIQQTTKEVILNINVEASSTKIVQELQEKLPKLKEFYQSSDVPIRITGKPFGENEKKVLKKMIGSEIDVNVKFDDTSDLLGLHAIKKTFEVETDISETKYVYHSVRSGNKEEYVGSIVICGDVNFGAEVVAGGNIVVLGTLRGMVHSGANGNTKATISANMVESTQIRIANVVKEIIKKEDKCQVFGIRNNKIEVLKD